MEKAVLKTLAYADMFDYPMKAWEIHKWLIGQQSSLQDVGKALGRLIKKGKVVEKDDYFYLKGRKGLVQKRISRQHHAHYLYRKARLVSWTFKLIPFVKLVGISGGLSMENVTEDDDVDLFIITSPNRLWMSRFFLTANLFLLGLKRSPQSTKKEAAGKICLNTLIDEKSLEFEPHDLYTAHEILQMKVLWQRGAAYTNFLTANSWALESLPNWITDRRVYKDPSKNNLKTLAGWILDGVEDFFRATQKRYMRKNEDMGIISEHIAYFYPKDYRMEKLGSYRSTIKSRA